jgi:hypothetical protein
MVIARIEAKPEGSGSGEVNQVIGEVVQQGTTITRYHVKSALVLLEQGFPVMLSFSVKKG